MKGFKKLILTSAILAASSSAFAMQAMDEESMSATTGQDGLTISLNSNINDMVIKYIDRDGVSGGGYTHAGGVVIGDTTNGLDISVTGLTIDIDAGGDTGDGGVTTSSGGMLQIKVGTTGATVIGMQNMDISVADGNDTANGGGSATGTGVPIISFDNTASLTIAATPNLATIQLGNEDQGHMVHVDANLGSIALTGMAINDANSGGSIAIGRFSASAVHLIQDIDVVAGGLQIATAAGSSIGEVGLEQVVLGDNTQSAIGDIYISNLNPVSTITIVGH